MMQSHHDDADLVRLTAARTLNVKARICRGRACHGQSAAGGCSLSHILPDIMPALGTGELSIAAAIIAEAALSS